MSCTSQRGLLPRAALAAHAHDAWPGLHRSESSCVAKQENITSGEYQVLVNAWADEHFHRQLIGRQIFSSLANEMV